VKTKAMEAPIKTRKHRRGLKKVYGNLSYARKKCFKENKHIIV
jgi:hypothetical protein